MNRFGIGLSSLICVAALTCPCLAQENPWNGSWKADPASMKFSGSTFSIATDADGYTVTPKGGPADPKIVCDGTPKEMPNGMMRTCTKNGAAYDITVMQGDKTTRKVNVSVSADGKTMTRKVENFPADGEPYTMTQIAKRLSGGPGVAGEWKESGFTESQDTGVLTIQVNGDSIDFKETDTPKPITCKLDGTETKLSETSSMSVKLVDPHTLKVTYSADGKVRRENTFAMSADGKTITETDVTPAPAMSTMTLTLHKV